MIKSIYSDRGILKKLIEKQENHSDTNVFFKINKEVKDLINEQNFFVANNSLQVDNKKIIPGVIKNKILFIGTLYKEKNIDELIDSFIEAKRKYNKEDTYILQSHIFALND